MLSLASWNRIPISSTTTDEDGIIADDVPEDSMLVCCGKNPLHVIAMERPDVNVSRYTLSRYTTTEIIRSNEVSRNWLFDRYHYCQGDGSILIPLYRFDCNEEGSNEDSP